MSPKRNAFVIMPFDEEFNSIYETLIRESLLEAGFEVTRADSFLNQQNILRDIVVGITAADLIVADLTTTNPNVFYELGLAHGLGIPTVLIAQSITDVPFDLRSYKVHVYDTHFNKIRKLKEFLKRIGEQHKTKAVSFGSPVIDFSHKSIPPEIRAATATTTPSAELPVSAEEKGLWDYVVDAETSANDMTAILAILVEENNLLTDRITRHGASMQAQSNSPTAGSARMFQRISLLAAADMNSFSKKVREILPQFEDAVDRMSDNYSGLIHVVKPLTQKDDEALARFRQIIEELLTSSRAAKTGMHSFLDATVGLGERKISKDLNRASRNLVDVLNGLIANIEKVEAFCMKALGMIDQRIGKRTS